MRAEAESRLKAVLEDTKRFALKFPAMAESWTLEDNVKIEMAMKDINTWDKQMSILMKECREVEILVKGNSLEDSEENINAMKQLVTRTQKLMDSSIKQVKMLDESRNLNSLGTRRSEHVKFPQFSGKVGEDFVTFQRKVVKAFSSNGVPTDDQVEKLRENLRDGAKLVVPEGTTDIDRAWEILEAAFGGEDKVIQSRKDKLQAMGSLPDANSLKGGQSRRITWCLELERVLSDILELGNRNEELAREAFSKSTINMIIGLFPPNIRRDMIKAAGDGSDKLLAIIDIIEAERAIFQEDDQFVTKKTTSGGGAKHHGGGSASSANLLNPRGYQNYRGPQRMPSCRICKTLEAKGDTALLYENHLGNYPTGCPRFATMTTEERCDIAKESKICMRCLDPKSNWVFRDGHKGCQVTKTKKNKFSCTNANCGWHSWICSSHKEDNKQLMNKFSADLAKRGITLVFFNSSEASAVDQESLQMLKSSSKVPKPSPQPWIRDASKDLTRDEAVEKLIKLTPNGTDLDTTDKGTPMFMFGSAEGKTRDIKILYDTGCSDLLMKDDVPGVQLEGVKVQQGPFAIGAVGGVQVMANDAWMVKVKMSDGACHVLEGLSVDRVTSNFPTVQLSDAVKAVKASKPQDKEIQNVKIPDVVGGEVDILLGIKYNALFPVLIHMLPSGLAIYKVKLKSFKNKYTAVIAGPHKSFNVLREKVGNTAYLLQQFEEGLQTWRSLGASKIREIMCPPVSEDDVSMAMTLNQNEYGDVDQLGPIGLDRSKLVGPTLTNLDRLVKEQTQRETPAQVVNLAGTYLPDSMVNRGQLSVLDLPDCLVNLPSCIDCGEELNTANEDTNAILVEKKDSISSIKKLVEAMTKACRLNTDVQPEGSAQSV